MAHRRSTQRARTLIGAITAATLVAAAVWTFGQDSSSLEPSTKIASTPRTHPAHPDSAASAPLEGEIEPSPTAAHTSPASSALRTSEVSDAERVEEPFADSGEEAEAAWLPNPEEDLGAEDAYFEELYGDPTPELIRSSLTSALRERFPDKRLTAEEEKRAGDALIRIRQLRLAMRGMPFTSENADERQTMIAEYERAITQLENELEIPILELTEPRGPGESGITAGPSGNPLDDRQLPPFGGGLDNDPRARPLPSPTPTSAPRDPRNGGAETS